MTGRGRKRGRPPKNQTPSDRGGTKKFNYLLLKKPKYLSNNTSATNDGSRASSPQESDGSRKQSRPSGSTRGRGRGRKSLTQASTSYSSRKGKSFESEYHYGSDFGDSDDKDDDLDDDLLIEPTSEEESPVDDVSESDFSLISFVQGVGRPPRPPSPDPIWLQDREFPDLKLPESSQDLLLSNTYVMGALSIYEVLRRFRHLVRLSPFRFEDFCAAIICDEQTCLLTDMHITLLKAILREEDIQGTHFGPLDQKDSTNISLYLIDAVTWPEVLRSYVESDKSFDREVYAILGKGDYPHTTVEDRLCVLKFLTDQFLTTNAVRDVMLQEGPIHYDDHCRNCHRLGDLLCCETCPATFHLECLEPPLGDVPVEDWQCGLCVAQKVQGVVDCMSVAEKQGVLIRHEFIGLDRHGRQYWFMARRLFVEDQLTGETWYYSTMPKLEAVFECLDSDDLESVLYARLEDLHDELANQFSMTLDITRSSVTKAGMKTYLDLERSGDVLATVAEEDASVPCNKLRPIGNDRKHFRLGMEQWFKTFVNQYAINAMALNKPQRNEERDKRRHLSHKFSLTTASDFKWIGLTIGTIEQTASTLRQTLLTLEQNIATPFLNPNWPALKRLWTNAVTQARKPSDFAIVLLLLQASLKNVVFANVWHEHLGHTELKRITAVEREERKKIEKREKREREEEEERYRYCQNFIKYVLGLRHQVFKQKGEEYRTHGQWSWMWLSSSRRVGQVPHPRGIVWGQKIIPSRVQVHYSNGPNTDHVVSIDPRTFRYMQQMERENAANINHRYYEQYRELKIHAVPSSEEVATYLKKEINHKSGVIDVSMGLNMPGRLLYPKVAPRSRLDGLLERRMELLQAEENLSEPLVKENDADSEVGSSSTTANNNSEYASPAAAVAAAVGGKAIIRKQTFLEKRMLRLVEQNPKFLMQPNNVMGVNHDLVNSLAKKIQTVRLQFSALNRFCKSFRCYARDCNTNSNSVAQISQNTCYSPQCLQKAKAKKELLLLLRRTHTAGNGTKETVAAILGAVKKPSILEQKLTEGRRSELGNITNSLHDEDTDMSRCHEEIPLDLIQDLEQANLMGDSYDDNLWQACCPPLTQQEQIDNMEKVKCEKLKTGAEEADVDSTKTATNANNISSSSNTNNSGSNIEQNVGTEDDSTFMDTLDVCDTVEVESTNIGTTTTTDETGASGADVTAIEDDITAQLTAAAEAEAESGVNLRKSKRSRTRSMSIGRESPIPKRNRRGRNGTRNKSLASEKNAAAEAAAAAAAEAELLKLKKEEQLAEEAAQKRPVRENRRFPSKMSQQAAAMAASDSQVKREDKEYFEREYYEDGRERVYSRQSTRGRIYLYMDAEKWREEALKEYRQHKVLAAKDDNNKDDPNKKQLMTRKFKTFVNNKRYYSKFPLVSNYLTHQHKKSLLVLPRYKLLKLARMGGKTTVGGFHHAAKNNSTVWPYPCSRPLFKTCWAYRTLNAVSLAAVGLQLRIMWSCMKWDDMIAKPPSADGKQQISSDTEIVTIELLRYRNLGRYGEKTQYLRRKIVIPLEVPKTIREVTSIRSGLRKRKRAESPQPTEPQVTEEWVDENKLDLWEIKFIGERQERVKVHTTTRAAAMRANAANAAAAAALNSDNSTSSPSTPSSHSNSASDVASSVTNSPNSPKLSDDVRDKIEQQLKMQRVIQQKRYADTASPRSSNSSPSGKSVISASGSPVTHNVINRRMIVKAPDGTTRIIQQAVSTNISKVNNGTNTANNNTHGNINNANSINNGSQGANYDSPQTISRTMTSNTTSVHKVQIIRRSDGKVSVRGLNPGQQLIQMPDGNLHVLTSSSTALVGGKVKNELKTQTGTVIGATSLKPVAVKQFTNTTNNSKNGTPTKLVLPFKPSNNSGGNNYAVNSPSSSSGTTMIVNSAGMVQQQPLIHQQQAHLTKLTTNPPPPPTTTTTTFNQNNNRINNNSNNHSSTNNFHHENDKDYSKTNNNNNMKISPSPITTVPMNDRLTVVQQQQQQQPQQQLHTANNIRIGANGRLEFVQTKSLSNEDNSNMATTTTQLLSSGTTTVSGATTTTTIPVAGQKVIQQIVNTSNVEQEILVGGQRIILNPGQTIVTERSLPPSASQQQQQQQQQQQPPIHQTQIRKSIPTTYIKPLVQQQNMNSSSIMSSTPSSPSTQNNQNSTLPAHHQLIVQNSAMAQQLAQGKLQVATINGQQVIIKPLGNNQAQIVAHVKTQNDGNSHIITSNLLADSPTQSPTNKYVSIASSSNQSHQQQQQQQQSQLTSNIQQQSDAGMSSSVPTTPSSTTSSSSSSSAASPATIPTSIHSGLSLEESMRLLQGQPPGTVIKCVTAQVIQTDQGPRIVLQGLVGNDFNPHQLALVQQQVKQQLLKAQESSGKQGVLGPTKIYLAVQPSQIAPILNSQPPPLTPVQQAPQQISSLERTTITSADANDSIKYINNNINQNNNNKFTNNADVSSTTTGASKVLNSGSGVHLDNSIVANDDSVVHGDIIREIEELQQHFDQQQYIQQQQQHETTTTTTTTTNNNNNNNQAIQIIGNRGEISTIGVNNVDTGKVQLLDDNNTLVINTLQQQQQQQQQLLNNKLQRSKKFVDVHQQLQQPAEAVVVAATTNSVISPAKRTVGNIIKRRESVTSYGRGRNKCDISTIYFSPTKPNPKLEDHKNELKKNILKKRSILEHNIRTEINEEMYNTKQVVTPTIMASLPPSSPSATMAVNSTTPQNKTYVNVAHKISDAMDDCENNLKANVVSRTMNSNTLQVPLSTSPVAATADVARKRPLNNKSHPMAVKTASNRKPRKTSASNSRGSCASRTPNTLVPRNISAVGRPRQSLPRKKEKLYCICLTPYDDTKFYVGCDICSNWYHGDCVNISEEDSKKLTEFICDDCKLARNTKKLYCLCRQPYDESQFYICCDKCQDWFHGRCVGIVQTEADFIDEYVCPDCQQNNTVTRANTKNLTEAEQDGLKKLVKAIKSHKSAWPFRQAVDPKEAPDYYNIIKEPMDLQEIEKKLMKQRYGKLSQFIGDMTKMFDNCRYYNDKDSTFFKCAEALESFFVLKIKEFRRYLINQT